MKNIIICSIFKTTFKTGYRIKIITEDVVSCRDLRKLYYIFDVLTRDFRADRRGFRSPSEWQINCPNQTQP